MNSHGQQLGLLDLPVDDPAPTPKISSPRKKRSSGGAPFYLSTSNRLAYSYVEKILNGTLSHIQRLLIFGGPGVGKTHLMEVVKHTPSRYTICSLTGLDLKERSDFYLSKMWTKKNGPLLCLIDDVDQYFLDKEGQYLLNSFFDQVRLNDALLLMSLRDRPLPELIPSLVCRLQATAQIELEKFDSVLAEKIFRYHLAKRDIAWDAKAQKLWEQHLPTQGHQIESLLNYLLLGEEGKRGPFAPASAPAIITPLAPMKNSAQSDEELVSKLCLQLEVKLSLLQGKGRQGPLCQARHQLMWALYEQYHWPYQKIARLLRRDHTSVLYAVKKMRDQLD